MALLLCRIHERARPLACLSYGILLTLLETIKASSVAYRMQTVR